MTSAGEVAWLLRAMALARRAALVAALALAVLAGARWPGVGRPAAAAGPFLDPHGGYTATADACATCHRTHTGAGGGGLNRAAPQSNVCFVCHNGTGANSNVASEYSDTNVPPNDPATSSFYAHPATTLSTHTNGQVDEFAGVLNRHAACGDCHNPHAANAAAPVQTANGWLASGALAKISGANAASPPAWVNPITYEDELCRKCHSSYTLQLSYTKASQQKYDVGAEFDPANTSYHPVEAPGRNASSALQQSLAGGKLWNFTTSSTIRCVNCHGNYRLVGSPAVPGTPPGDARLAPHTSRYRGLLIANYRDRDLKPANELYNSGDFALCFLCHREAPFTDVSGDPRPDTNYPFHGVHISGIRGMGAGGLEIDTAGAGQGNAICAECHFRTHGTAFAPWSANRTYPGDVNFAPDVQPVSGAAAPVWDRAARTCTLVCHGKSHNPMRY